MSQINIDSRAALQRAIETPGVVIAVLAHWQPRLVGSWRRPKLTRKSGRPGIQKNGYYFDGPRHPDGEIVEMWAELPKAAELRFNADGTVIYYPAGPKSWTLRFTGPTTAVCKRTPWGHADNAEEYVPGVTWYDTPSHGGFHLDRAHNAQVPDYMRREGGWYEEDCDWAIVATVFPTAFICHGEGDVATTLQSARDTMRNWHPDAYEKFYGVELKPGESFKRDIKVFEAAHANDLMVICAWGEWHEKVPEGKTGVMATIGGSREPGVAKRYFLLPKDEYRSQQPGCGMVIDPARYQEIEPIA